MDPSRGIGTFVVWDYVVFAGMLLISAAIGIYYAFAGDKQQTSKDFLMGGRRMSAVPVALSLTASFMSAVTVLGTPTEVYRFGAIFSLFGITYLLVVVISAEIFLPVFYRLGITSTYEFRTPRGMSAEGSLALPQRQERLLPPLLHLPAVSPLLTEQRFPCGSTLITRGSSVIEHLPPGGQCAS
ncbi:Sodium-coupled monocarboxylate transporter 1 [Myotis davidii]|uniref:Sodium-coupled monocarboxylate transporter 1 n=1 Tax=Myotis davidii TaxID=225400 RepID=L5LI55_MYODS|nr:Sodium-coupled monocarboxylate transporter 1 [Myotis davidii]